ncbi:MAG: ELWxxDGT repeat protein [Pseudomonadota bacterium]
MPSLFFAADDGSIGYEFYISDGETITVLGDLNPGPEDAAFDEDDVSLAAALSSGQIVFIANTEEFGSEVWITDGTVSGTMLLADIEFGPNDSEPVVFVSAGDRVYFIAETDEFGNELYITDGTTAGTTIVRDINPGSFDGFNQAESISIHDGKVFLVANDGSTGNELYITDGTDLGTRRVKDIFEGGSSSDIEIGPGYSATLGNTGSIIFAANDGEFGYELWRSDGTEEGTVMVADINSGPSGSGIEEVYEFGDRVVFSANNGSDGRELWITDGTSGGTRQVADIDDGNGSSDPEILGVVGDLLLFAADDNEFGKELWATDGSSTGTRLVRDIDGGGDDSFPDNGKPFFHSVIGDVLIFSADDGSTGEELYFSDGTTLGTGLLRDIYEGSESSSPEYLATVGDEVFFSAESEDFGRELWKTDGTSEGTVRLGDIDPGSDSSDPLPLAIMPDAAPLFTPGDDTVDNTPADDEFDGLGGRDTIVYDANREDVTETLGFGGRVTIEVGDETDMLENIERVELNDGAYIFDISDNGDFIYRLYSAAFVRTPDEEGFRFNVMRSDNGQSDKFIADSFTTSDEFLAEFGTNPTDEEFVNNLYIKVLQREADAGGLEFWTTRFESGELSRGDMLIRFAASDENVARTADDVDDGFWVTG